ncbi:MAG: glycosyltransferase family 4 protein [Halobacteriovoraceae bacterium]|nr:glycosyltransferase family 4 protein [Halobacteriovoraceae bacterium]
MRIGFDAKRAFHNNTGLGNYSRNLFVGLQKYFPQHEYLYFSPPLKNNELLFWGEQNIKMKNVITPAGIMGKNFSSLWRSVFISRELEKYHLDIYHGLSHELPFGIHHCKLKKIVTMHDLIFMRFPHFFKTIDRTTYLKKIKYACKCADVIVAICEQTKRDLINFLNVPEKKIQVVYQTCSPMFYEKLERYIIQNVLNKHHIYKKYFFYVGSLNERKNVLTLIDAFHRSGLYGHYQLVIAGAGKEYQTKCRTRVDKLRMFDDVLFLGNIENNDLPALYQGALAFVYPSLFEGFGIPIIEALFSGTPVITSKGSCFPEAAGPDSIYIDTHSQESIDELAMRLIEIEKDISLRDRMSSKGLEYVQKFEIKNTTQNMIDLYKKII